jgi:hypothetical protein
MWAALLTLRIAHAFYDGPAPVRVALAPSPEEDAKPDLNSLHMRSTPGQLSIWSSDAQDRPRALWLDVFSTSPAMLAVTPIQMQSGTVTLQAELPIGVSEWDLPMAAQPASPMSVNRPLARLHLLLPQEGEAQMNLRLPATEARLAYHILGTPREGLGILDREAEVSFVAIGQTTLPDGRLAQSFRSDRAVALHRRVGARFSLTQQGPFGPQTLIPALPGPIGVSGYADGNSAQLQSDMYVTL